MYSINNSLQDLIFVNDNTKELVIPKSYVRCTSLLERMDTNRNFAYHVMVKYT